jgi:uncharacterized protein (TIGR02145 family)
VIALCNTSSSFTDNSGWIWGNAFSMNGGCTITPSIAQAGSDQMDITGASTTLAAISPAIGVGVWSIVSGTGGNIANIANSSSNFTGTAGTTYVLRWTVSNSCGTSSDDVTIEFEEEAIGTVSDIDSNSYATIKIGTQTWMAENLKTTKYNDGTSIPMIDNNNAWINLTTGAWSYYNNMPSNNNIYGKIYNWYAVNTTKLCPQGWHIPTDAEWTILTDYLGGESVAGGNMKSVTGWNSPNTGATNGSGFSGLPGGFRFKSGIFKNISNYAFWWSATEYDANYALNRSLGYASSLVFSGSNFKERGTSCRCLRD